MKRRKLQDSTQLSTILCTLCFWGTLKILVNYGNFNLISVIFFYCTFTKTIQSLFLFQCLLSGLFSVILLFRPHCVCERLCVCGRLCVRVYIYTLFKYICTCVFECMCVYVHMFKYVGHVYVYVCVSVCAHVCAHVCSCVCASLICLGPVCLAGPDGRRSDQARAPQEDDF